MFLPCCRRRSPKVNWPGGSREADAAVVMKVGRHLPKLRRALATSGRLPRAIYVERGTMAEEKIDSAVRQVRR